MWNCAVAFRTGLEKLMLQTSTVLVAITSSQVPRTWFSIRILLVRYFAFCSQCVRCSVSPNVAPSIITVIHGQALTVALFCFLYCRNIPFNADHNLSEWGITQYCIKFDPQSDFCCFSKVFSGIKKKVTIILIEWTDSELTISTRTGDAEGSWI